MSSFLNAVQTYDALNENGAITHSTSGDKPLDYFSNAGMYRDRSIEDVYADVSEMWSIDPERTLRILFYNRMITRKISDTGIEQVQRGQGTRDEFRKAISWVAKYHPKTFNQNAWLIPVVGCWKDLWHKDLEPHISDKCMETVVRGGLMYNYSRELIAKYIPKIRSKINTHNEEHVRKNALARKICRILDITEKDYRKFKSNGKAHYFQRQMTEGSWQSIDFSKIPGKALFQLANSKGRDRKTTIERHGIESRYIAWLEKQPVAKFTGYPYELMAAITPNLSRAQKITIDKQFQGLIETAKQDNGGINGNVWCAIDTSGSMGIEYIKDITALDICLSLGIFFSTMNVGAFKDNVVMFDSISKIKQLSGSFSDKVSQLKSATIAWGSTNFQSVIDEIIRVRKNNPEIPIKDYPTTLLVVSDMQFDPSDRYSATPSSPSSRSNHRVAMDKLRSAGLPEIEIIWWQVSKRIDTVVAKHSFPGQSMLSGCDGSIISTILGGETTVIDKETNESHSLNSMEIMLKVLDQEILQRIRCV